MNYRSIIYLVLFLAAIHPASFSQPTIPTKSHTITSELHHSLLLAADSAILIQQKNVDSLSHALELSLNVHSTSYTALADSLMKEAQELLDPARIDSASRLQKEFTGRLNAHGTAQRKDLSNQLFSFAQSITQLKNIHEACLDCTEPEDILNELSSFYEHADSSSDEFVAALTDRFDEANSSISDSTESLCDSLRAFVETLIDTRDAELDSIELHSNKFMIALDANSVSYFHGHDGGISQAVVSPLVSFRHSSGVKLSLGTSWMERQDNHWDATSLGLSYEFMVSPVFGGSIGYTHFWFDSSSTEIRSVFNQSVSGELDLSTSIADFSLAAEINFDHESEYDFEFTATHYWQFGRTVTLAPTVKAAWGEQNLTLIAHQLQKIQRKNPLTKKIVTRTVAASTSNQSNIFSILDYEIVVPLSVRIGRFILTPSLTAVFPLAVFDGSRDLPFLNAELTATMDWIW
jgi:hypothetical protein